MPKDQQKQQAIEQNYDKLSAAIQSSNIPYTKKIQQKWHKFSGSNIRSPDVFDPSTIKSEGVAIKVNRINEDVASTVQTLSASQNSPDSEEHSTSNSQNTTPKEIIVNGVINQPQQLPTPGLQRFATIRRSSRMVTGSQQSQSREVGPINFDAHIDALQKKQNDVQQKLADLKGQKKFMSRKDYENQESRLTNQLRDIIKEKWSSFIENNVENVKEKKSSIKSLLDSPNRYLDQYSESKDIKKKLKIDTTENKDILKNVLQEMKRDLKRDEQLNSPPKSILRGLLKLFLPKNHTR